MNDMTMERIDDATVKVSLSRGDLSAQGIAPADLAEGRATSAPLLRHLLGILSIQTGRKLSPEQVFLEIFPNDEGGCLLYFHLLPTLPREHSHRLTTPLVFSFADLDALSGGVGALFSRYSHFVRRSALYFTGERYRLVVEVYHRLEPRVTRMLTEYGEFIGKGEIQAAVTAEHGKCIAEEQAVEILYESLC